MKTLLLFTITFLSFFSNPSENKCSQWLPFGQNGIEANLFLRTCENENGDGSLEIKNENEKDVKLTYVINFNNGESTTATVLVPLDDKTSKIICLNCIESKGGGIASWKFENIIFEGEAGY